MKAMKENLYTARELAQILKCNPQTIYRKGQSGEIPRIQVGRLVRFYMPKEQEEYEERGKSKSSDSEV